MISFLRRLIGSKLGAAFALVFLLLVAFAFAAGDVSKIEGFGSLTSFGGTTTKIGSKSISENDLQARVQRVFEQQRRENAGMQINDFLTMGAVPKIYDELVSAISLEQYAHKQGMYASKRMVDAEIAKIPAFQDATGKFSQNAFRQILSAQKVSEQELRNDISMQLTGQLLSEPAGMGSHLPDSLVLPYASLLLEAREGKIAAIPSVAFKPNAPPTDAQLKDFYAKNAARFMIPEQRRLRYAIVDGERFAPASMPTDGEIAKYYAQHKSDYAARETRTIDQLILPTESAAKAAASSASLAEAAKSAGLSVATFKQTTAQDFARQSSAAAAGLAFGAPQGKIAGPVKLALGWVVIETTAIQKIPERPLDTVKPEIVKALSDAKRKIMLRDFVAKIEDNISNGGTFDEVVKDNGLKVETPPLLVASGQSPADPAYQPPGDVAPLIKPAFDMESDDDAQFVPLAPDQRYALLDVTDIVAPAPPPLDKVKALVAHQYLLHEGANKARALATKISAEAKKGVPLDQAVARAGIPLPPVQPISARRADLLRQDKRLPAELSILFAMPQGSVKVMPIPDDRGVFLIQLNKIVEGDAAKVPGLVEQVRGDLSRVVGTEYGRQFGNAVEDDLGVERKAALIAKVTQELRRANGAATQ